MAYEQEWAFLRAALPDLQDYLLSNELYWPLRLMAHTPGSLQIPQLTIGNLLLSQTRLSALTLPQGQADELAGIVRQIQQVRETWRSNWSRKAGREFASRLKLWQQYVSELRGEIGRSAGRPASGYATEVRQRAILRLLSAEILGGLPRDEAEQVDLTDNILRGLTRAGDFVWEPEVAPGFPQQDFWFLYRTFGS